ncbi:MAG: hypothetical protein AAF492_14220 [Verrucomicrobiota bacterium]
MRAKELDPVLAEYRRLPREQRLAELEDPALATPPRRIVPQPPANGLIIRGYCTYLKRNAQGFARSKQYYYKQNPNRWAAETQSDMLWLTETEWRTLIPENPEPGQRMDVIDTIQQRFFSTIGIDYMEGSVNALPANETQMHITVENVTEDIIQLRLDGTGQMGTGRDMAELLRDRPKSRGCEIRILGHLTYDRKKQRLTRFDIAGVGHAWGNKMEYTRRAIHLDDYPWLYGIACELIEGDTPMERIPPYNLLHYGSGLSYFPKPKNRKQ